MEKHPYDELIETVADKMKELHRNKTNYTTQLATDILQIYLTKLKLSYVQMYQE